MVLNKLDGKMTNPKINNLPSDLEQRAINALYPPESLSAASGDDTADDTAELQAMLDYLDDLGGGTLFLPKGTYKITSALTLTSLVILKGAGINITVVKTYGCGMTTIDPEFGPVIQDMSIQGYTSDGTFAPKTEVGIKCAGTGASPLAVNKCKFRFLQIRGFLTSIDLRYTWSSSIDNVETLDCTVGVQLFGQSVNNSISNCMLTCDNDTGSASVKTVKDGSVQGEGLMISNSLLASGKYGVFSDGFLSLHITNCVIDLIETNAINVTSVLGLCLENSWLYATGDAIVSNNVATAEYQYCKVIGCTITSVSGSNGIFIGASVQGWIFKGNTIKANAVCLYLEIVSSRCIVQGNNFFSNTSSVYPIFMAGTGHDISHNRGDCAVQIYNPEGRNSVFNNEGMGGVQVQGAYGAAPTSGTWKVGDMNWNVTPDVGKYAAFLNVIAGTPGTHVGIVQVSVKKDTTANRPASGIYAGYMYLDTTLATDGKPIWYNGSDWVDSSGTVV